MLLLILASPVPHPFNAAHTRTRAGSNYTLTFALASVPTALALVWMLQVS